MENRYTELKKENDILLNELPDSYKFIALNYIKKARGYGVRGIDTESKIKLVLMNMRDASEEGVDINIYIPNQTTFIESEIQQLSKSVKDPDRLKTIILTIVVVLLFGGWGAFNCYLKKDKPLETPTSFTVTKLMDQKVRLTWELVDYATNGYVIYYIDELEIKGPDFEVSNETNSFDININSKTNYTFYIYAKQTDLFLSSKTAVYIYDYRKA